MNNLKKLIPYFVIIITITIITSFQGKLENIDYDEQWKKVEKFTQKGQPKSALKIVDNIYMSAKSDENTSQIIKALINRISLQSSYDEDHILKSIAVFEKELSNASTPEKQILQSLIAELYQAYYNTNRWIINKRQPLVDDKSTDISTWDAVKLNKVVQNYYNSSLKNKTALEQVQLNDYKAILLNGNKSEFVLWPSLFDLLSNRALDYFTSNDAEFAQIGAPHSITNTNYFLPANQFVNLKIDSKKSAKAKVLSLFQGLLDFHIKQNNTEALVNLDLKRLQYVADNSSQNSTTQNNYINALTSLSDKYNNHPVYVSIAYKLANQYFISGNNYIPKFNKSSKYNLIVADSICKVAINKFSEVVGTNSCLNLIEKINKIDFGFEIAVAEMPDNPILSLVEFKNIDKLYFKIISSNPKENANKSNRKGYLLNELKQQNEVLSWKQKLPITTDHRMHNVEVKIPKLEPGYYIIFASSDSLFRTSENIKFKPIWITNLSYITSTNKVGGFTEMYTLNRETGKSIGDVNITIYKREYNNKIDEW